MAEWFSQLAAGFMSWWTGFQLEFYQNFIQDDRYMWLIDGIGVTLKVSVLSALLGVVIGLLAAIAILSNSRFLRTIARWYTDFIRGTPTVIQLLIMYFVIFGSSRLDQWIIASFAFAINSGAYVTEIIRAGILSVDHGQMEAGRSLGLSKAQTMTRIIIPQAVKNILPALVNEFIVLIKETAIVGYIGLSDLTKAADFIRSRTYSAFMPLVGTAIIYFLIIKILTKLFGLLERRMRKSDIR